MSADLATIASDPRRIESVPPNAIPEMLGAVEVLRAMLWARLQANAVPAPVEPPRANGRGPDVLLTAQQAAERLGVSRRWMYSHAPKLGFTKRLSGGTLRFSERGLERWKESRI